MRISGLRAGAGTPDSQSGANHP